MAIKIELEKDGFPIEFLGISFFVETSAEKLQERYLRCIDFEEKQQKLKEEVLATNPEINENEAIVSNEKLTIYLDNVNRLNKLQYDTILEDGAYEKIYEVFPNAVKLQAVSDQLADAINKEIDVAAEKQSEYFADKKVQIMTKKAQKRTK